MALALNQREHGRAKTSGLTLVEVAVVMAMTAILSALLLPALSTAKEKSRRAVCQCNLRQLLVGLQEYAADNDDIMLSCADDKGYYHSIILSETSFTNLVAMAGGNSNLLYCPNIVFGNTPNALPQHLPNIGYIIGYSYLAASVNSSSKAPDSSVQTTKWPYAATNELLADANFWTPSSVGSGYFQPMMKVAPHAAMGAVTSQNSSFTVGLPGNSSACIGATGGNIGFVDEHVKWLPLTQMQTNAASSTSIPDAYGAW
jgi:Tfp pilus assembly protein PilE